MNGCKILREKKVNAENAEPERERKFVSNGHGVNGNIFFLGGLSVLRV